MLERGICNLETHIANVRQTGLPVVVAEAVWHQFPAPGGITGLLMLAESHLTVHTFPEHASVCLNLFCCTPRETWPWATQLAVLLGARDVRVRQIARAYADEPSS